MTARGFCENWEASLICTSFPEVTIHSGRIDMAELQQTLDRLTTLPMFEAEGPATAEEIKQIETELCVTLPEQYVEFLKRFGYVGWFGNEILGIRPIDRLTGQRSTVTFDCVSRTKKSRRPDNPLGTANFSREHVIIATDGGGGNYLLFTAGSPHEGEVHYYNFEDRPDPIHVWKTFQDYLEHRIEEAVGT